MLMAAPLALGGVEIEIIVKLISIPYVEMTLRLMERFGVKAEHSDSWDRFYTTGDPPFFCLFITYMVPQKIIYIIMIIPCIRISITVI